MQGRYHPTPVPDTTLYFAYASFLDPDRIAAIAPDAKFLFTAHYPETRLAFVTNGTSGAMPSLVHDPAHTVWGGVFEIPDDQVEALTAAEKKEGRAPGFHHKAVDREGNKYDCLAFVASGDPDPNDRPSPDYLETMVRGARHWHLPAGWVLGLEDLEEDPLFS